MCSSQILVNCSGWMREWLRFPSARPTRPRHPQRCLFELFEADPVHRIGHTALGLQGFDQAGHHAGHFLPAQVLQFLESLDDLFARHQRKPQGSQAELRASVDLDDARSQPIPLGEVRVLNPSLTQTGSPPRIRSRAKKP